MLYLIALAVKFPATAEPDCRDAKARDISAQLSVGNRRRYKRMQLLYEGLCRRSRYRYRMGKGTLAPCPPSIAERTSLWWARCRFAHPYGLRTDLHCAQAQFRCTTATNWHDGQITQNLSSPVCKNIPLNFESKSPVAWNPAGLHSNAEIKRRS